MIYFDIQSIFSSFFFKQKGGIKRFALRKFLVLQGVRMGVVLGGVISAILGIAMIFAVIAFIGRVIIKLIVSLMGIGFLLFAIYFGYQWYKGNDAEIKDRIKKELSSKESQEIIQKVQSFEETLKEEVKKQIAQ